MPKNKIQNFDFGNWMSTSDYSLMENIKSNLVIPLINFRGKLNMTDSYINESINTIENYLNRIERFPTILQISIIKHLLQKLKDLLEKYCSSIHLDEPDPLVVAESYSAIDESGNILVELGVHNKGAKVYPITDISVIPVPNDRYKVEERTLYKKDKNVELKSEEFSIFCFNVQVVETYRNDKSITLWFEVNYIVETKPRSKQCDIQIDIKKDFFKWIGNNPFSNFGKKVENPKMFFGRQGDIDEIIDIICPKEIDSNSSFPARQCLLYGQKRSGKSSVLGFVKKKLVQDERIFCVDVNFLNIDSQSECYYKILNAINTELKNIQDDDEELSDDMPSLNLPFDFTKANYTIEFELFQNYIREFKRSMQKSLNPLWKNKQLFVLIDEFSSVFKAIKDPEKDINERFLENWRVLQEDNTSEFSSILICQDIMQSFLRDYGNTNVLSIFQPKRLTYLKPEYARDLIIQPVISRCNVPDFYLEGSIDRILYYTACSAYYTVIFCYTLLNYVSRNRLSHVTKEDVEIVANEVVISEIIKKDKFDALLLAGEDNRVSVFSKEEVQDILDQIAEVEIANPKGCEPSTLKRRCTDSSFSDADYIKSIVSDLNKRDVIKKDDGRLLLNIKLYLLWYQANKV